MTVFPKRAAWALALLVCVRTVRAQSGTYNWSNAVPLSASYPGILRSDAYGTCLRIDLNTRGLRFYTTGRCSGWVDGDKETVGEKTPNFISGQQSTSKKVVAAINADLFSYNGSYRDLRGYNVSEGVKVSSGNVGGGAVTRTFTVLNDGLAPLTLAGMPRVVLGGPNAGDFSVPVLPAWERCSW